MSSAPATSSPTYLAVRQDWLDRRQEPILEPDLAIVDAHHHLWDRPGWRYLLDELLADTNTGHNVVATVFVQARAMLRAAGPVEMRPVGETEFVNGVAAMSASGSYGKTRACAGIVGHADLTLGSHVEPVLLAHIRAGGDRFRGIRHITAWDRDASMANPAYNPPPGLLGDKRFRQGFAALDRLGLSFDAWLYHPQIGELAELARAFPRPGLFLIMSVDPLVLVLMPASTPKCFPVGLPLSRRWPRAGMSTSNWADLACAWAASASTRGTSRPPPKCWPPRGAPMSSLYRGLWRFALHVRE